MIRENVARAAAGAASERPLAPRDAGGLQSRNYGVRPTFNSWGRALAIASQSLAVRAFDDIAIAAIEPAARTPIAALAGKQALSSGGTIAAARLVAAFEAAYAVYSARAGAVRAHAAAAGFGSTGDVTGPCFTVEVAVSVVRASTLAVGTRTGTIRSRGTVDVARGSIAHEVTTAIAAAGAFAIRAGSRAAVVVSTALDVAGRGGALEVAFRARETNALTVAAFAPGLTSGGRNQQAQEQGDRMTHNG